MSDDLLFDASLRPQISHINLPFSGPPSVHRWSVHWQQYTVKAPTEESPRKRRKQSAAPHVPSEEDVNTLCSAKHHVEELASITEPDLPIKRYGIRSTLAILHQEDKEKSLWLFEILPSHAAGLIGPEGLPGLQVAASGQFDFKALFPALVKSDGSAKVLHAQKTPSLTDLTPGGNDLQLQAAFNLFISAARQAVIQNALQLSIPQHDIQRRSCGDGVVFLSRSPDFTPIIYLPVLSIRLEGFVLTGVWRTCSYSLGQSFTETSALRLCPVDIEAQYIRPYARIDYSFRWSDEPKKLGRQNARLELAQLPHLRTQFKQIYPFAKDDELEVWLLCKMTLDGQEKQVVWPKSYTLTSTPKSIPTYIDPRSWQRMSLQDLADATAGTLDGMAKERNRAAKAAADGATAESTPDRLTKKSHMDPIPVSIQLPTPLGDQPRTWAEPVSQAPVSETVQAAAISQTPISSSDLSTSKPTPQQVVATQPKAFDFGMDWMQDTSSNDYWGGFDDTFATKPIATKPSRINDYDMFDNMMGGLTEDDFNFFDDPSDDPIPSETPASFATAAPFDTMTPSSFPVGASPLTFPSPMYDYPTPQQSLISAPINGFSIQANAPSSHPTNSTDYPSVSPGYHNLFEASPANMQSPVKTPATPFTPSVDDGASPRAQSQSAPHTGLPPSNYAAGVHPIPHTRLDGAKDSVDSFAPVPFSDMASPDILAKYRLNVPEHDQKARTKYQSSKGKTLQKTSAAKKRRYLVSCLPRNWKALDSIAEVSCSEASSDEETRQYKQSPRIQQTQEEHESLPSVSLAAFGFVEPSQQTQTASSTKSFSKTAIEAHYEQPALCSYSTAELLPSLSRLFKSIQDPLPITTTTHLEPPKIKVCRAGSILQADIGVLSYWEKANLSPLYGLKNVHYHVLSSMAEQTLPAWVQRLSAFYESAGLGQHTAGITESNRSRLLQVASPITALGVRKLLRQLDKDIPSTSSETNVVYIPYHLMPPDQLALAKRWLKPSSFDKLTVMVLPSVFPLDEICTPRLYELQSMAFKVYERVPLPKQPTEASKMARTPAYTLAQQSSDWSVAFEAQWPPVTTDVRNRNRFLHIAYTTSTDKKLLSIIATDDLCEGSHARFVTISSEEEQIQAIWKFVCDITNESGVEWRICIGKLGMLNASELAAWSKLLTKTVVKHTRPCHVTLISAATSAQVPILPSTSGPVAQSTTLPPVVLSSSLPRLLHAYLITDINPSISTHQSTISSNIQAYDLARALLYYSSKDCSSHHLAYSVSIHLTSCSVSSTYTATMYKHFNELISSLANLSYYSQARSLDSRQQATMLPWHLDRLAQMTGSKV